MLSRTLSLFVAAAEEPMENKKLKILIADDEDGLRLSMAGIIEMEGHEVVTAADGYEAIECAKKNSFDIAFLDIKMPGINGVETFKQIKKITPETVVVMMTAYAVQHLIKEAISEGAYACMNKPFDMDKIMETIKEVSRKPFVVVIEDDPTLCTTFDKKLKEQGLNVVTRSSGAEGVELVQRRMADVIFLHLTKNSLEAFKKMKESLGDKAPKIILLGNDPADPVITEIQKLGAAEFMKEPLNAEEMKDAIGKVLMKNKKLKVCIVDDDKSMCDSLKDLLASGGYDVDTAYTGDEMLKKMGDDAFKSDDLKIVILDVRLPDVNGLEIYEKIKSVNPGIGVIFISGVELGDNVDSTIKKNNYIYLHKPFDPENLISMIERIRAMKP
jgi:two-component system, NtrC family, response regulator HydG